MGRQKVAAAAKRATKAPRGRNVAQTSGGTERRRGELPGSARRWLRENGYDDIADLIDAVMAKWASEGKATRRNWWEVLAGDLAGNPRSTGGVEFPVLAAARERLGLPPTKNAIRRRSERAEAPDVRHQQRWMDRK